MKDKKKQEEILEEEEAKAPATEETEQPETQAGGEEARLQEENAALNDRLLRMMAEFDNYKKRTAKEKQDLGAFSKSLCVKEILPTVDNFERALAAPCKDEDFGKGMKLIFDQLVATLTKLGVEEIPALGQPFDPEVHNAIKQVEDENFGENTVCEVLQKGYRMEGKVIRHAMVVVANP